MLKPNISHSPLQNLNQFYILSSGHGKKGGKINDINASIVFHILHEGEDRCSFISVNHKNIFFNLAKSDHSVVETHDIQLYNFDKNMRPTAFLSRLGMFGLTQTERLLRLVRFLQTRRYSCLRNK
jgi:hypothetical protein